MITTNCPFDDPGLEGTGFRRCSNCIFYKSDGQCHKHPPQISVDKHGNSIVVWPVIDAPDEHWCAEGITLPA